MKLWIGRDNPIILEDMEHYIERHPEDKIRYAKLHIFYDKPTYFDPIELTEEMLVSLFGKPRTNGNKFDIYTIPTNGIEIQDRRKSALPTPTICILKFGVHIYNIKYLHQLQNSYYLLAGQELEVEL